MTNTNFAPVVWMFVLPLVAVLLPVWLGQRYGLYKKRTSAEIHDSAISSAVGATLGLFAFLLAFTFQIVGNRYDKRKELFVIEISEIRTSWLYAGLIPEPFRSRARKHIVDYVDLRVQLRRDLSKFPEIRMKSQRILDSLWNYSEALAEQDRSSEAYSLFISSISEIVRSFDQRVTITQARLPATILYVLSFVAFFSMLTLGFQFGISGRVSFLVNLILGITFAAVMWLVFALDNPEAGIIKITETPLITLQQQLHQR